MIRRLRIAFQGAGLAILVLNLIFQPPFFSVGLPMLIVATGIWTIGLRETPFRRPTLPKPMVASQPSASAEALKDETGQ